ncbi:MAG: S41 family peptidase [bacterium]|nr:S41 family peptidase [bacterium]MDD3625351.1 S41 family peptidase [Proteiniphilum sp.]MDD3968424.1 S41 family peptidase [Proteiniphilum sp.]MDD4458668.1 S41 family peptidase [Proteiniphilum sp.]
MKNIIPSFIFFLSIALVWTSCQHDEPSGPIGDIVSAKYNPATQSFIVKYNSGREMSYPATVDNNVDPPTASYLLDDKTYLYVPDATIAGDATISEKIHAVSQFVYDGMSSYYLWADYMTNKKPTIRDVDPEKYFKSVLYTTDKQKGWSWITDDVSELLADFNGEPLAFGYSLAFATTAIQGEYYAVVKYVFPNTPASDAGMIRKELIGKINGQPITDNNWQLLYGREPVTLTIYQLTSTGIVEDRTARIAPVTIKTDPVLIDTVYQIGEKKIGYLFYTDYISNYNNRLFEVFSKFKQAGVTDLVLDIRYNHGGGITAATYLSSLVAPQVSVKAKSPFVGLSYNSFLNQYFDRKRWSRIDSLGVYAIGEQNPIEANLNLNKIYIIATGDSYSASELTTFCLRPYMNVVHIGGNTGGKYTASWTLHAYDEELGVPIYETKDLTTNEQNELKNWAMQPIVAKFTDGDNESFEDPGYLEPDIPESEGYIEDWRPLGDTSDRLLGQAIYSITGDLSYKPAATTLRSTGILQSIPSNRFDRPNDLRKESVILDNITILPDELRKIITLQKLQ